ncbi:hypothetical protein LIER_12277 [Lithospermum erythrorhizon]|uniref:Uncharacterized protein n=1 Tax=Lithospermum erythrorhizon TaxID=34254 RepID=A0AAV3PR71_LITER
MLKDFLWKGVDSGRFLLKVSWKQAILRKEEGGLGIKGIYVWNVACMAKHLWNLCSNKEALWVKWINTYRLKGQNFWRVKRRSIDSWSWSKIGIPAKFLSKRSISILRMATIDIVAHPKEVIKWPRRRALTSDITTFRNGISENFDEDEDEDNLIWFRSKHHKFAQVCDSLRVKPGNVR